MDLSWTPRAKFPRKKFVSPSAAAPYRSPLMHNLPEKRVQSSFENVSDELKTPAIALGDKNDAIKKEKQHQVPQKFVSPVAAASPYRSPFARNIVMDRKAQLPSINISLDELRSSTIELWEKNKVLKEKIYHLEENNTQNRPLYFKDGDWKEEELKWYIDKLHRYNEIKDIAQTVMGRLAISEEKTIKEVHEDFCMTEND